jgi:hypothetical protein
MAKLVIVVLRPSSCMSARKPTVFVLSLSRTNSLTFEILTSQQDFESEDSAENPKIAHSVVSLASDDNARLSTPFQVGLLPALKLRSRSVVLLTKPDAIAAICSSLNASSYRRQLFVAFDGLRASQQFLESHAGTFDALGR